MKWKQSDYSCIIYVGYCSQAIHRLSLITQITEAYNNSSSIPIDKLSFTFGIPLTLQLELNFKVHCNSAGLDGSFGRTWAMGSGLEWK